MGNAAKGAPKKGSKAKGMTHAGETKEERLRLMHGDPH